MSTPPRGLRNIARNGLPDNPQQPKLKPSIFVSHSGDDEFIHILCKYLLDYDVVLSDWRDKAGEPLAPKVRDDISRSDLIVVVLTEPALRSQWVQQEIGFALGREKKVVPVLASDTSAGDKLPALLAGSEWIPYAAKTIPESALRTAMRVSEFLKGDAVRIFRNDWEYREWWASLDERIYSAEHLYWATPHDTWSGIMTQVDQEPTGLAYYTLIRGDLEFDRKTASRFYSPDEVVLGVQELSGTEETCVIGNLVVHTQWEPEFQDMVDTFLQTAPSMEELIQWYGHTSRQETRIKITVSLDATRAADQRRILDALWKKYRRA